MILAAARSAFASRGYDGTTIRAVAAQAEIDPSMVMRYFGNKAGLFAAAATSELDVPDLTQAPPARRGEALVQHVVDRWENRPDDDVLVFLLRTAVTNEAVAAQLQQQLDDLLTAPIAALGDPNAARRATLIATQLLGLALCRYVLRLEPLKSLPIDDVIAAITPTVQRYLTEPIVESSATR